MARCPLCRTQVGLIKYEGVPIYNCGTCGGHWLTPNKLDVILARRDVVMPEPVQRRMIEIANESNSSQRLWCWTCGREMVKEAFKHWDEIQIDRCTKCGGVWLDRGELEKCQIFWEYMQNHPDTPAADLIARKAALEAQWRDRRAQIRAEAEERADNARMMGSLGFRGGLLPRMLGALFR
jgi:Zn-finger nucleic acid-binding protein